MRCNIARYKMENWWCQIMVWNNEMIWKCKYNQYNQYNIMWTYVIIIWCEIWYNDGIKWYDVIKCIMIKMMLLWYDMIWCNMIVKWWKW